ncbi:hypothetical protein PTKIN_Ptkin03bG0027300 [Pterospermum kingtungense]
MASTCISNCINDTKVPVRPTFVNLYKWPESDAEFVRSLNSGGRRGGGGGGGGRGHPTVVDSISCRQMYLRSYKFHRNDDEPAEKTKCFGRVKNNKDQKVVKSPTRKKKYSSKTAAKNKKCMGLKRAKQALLAMFRRMLSCTTKVDVADP